MPRIKMTINCATLGDLLGAALMNMLVLAGLDMLQPSRGRMLSRAAAHALSGTMAMTLLAITGIAVFIPDRLNVSVGGVGHRALVRRRSILPGPATRLL